MTSRTISKSILSPTGEDNASIWKNRTASESAFSDEHPLSVPRNKLLVGEAGFVAQENGGFVVAKILDE